MDETLIHTLYKRNNNQESLESDKPYDGKIIAKYTCNHCANLYDQFANQ